MKTTFEKFRRGGHIMVISQSAPPTSVCDTLLAAIGRFGSVRSSEATTLHMSDAVYSVPHLVLWSCRSSGRAGHFLYVSHADRQRPRGPPKDA